MKKFLGLWFKVIGIAILVLMAIGIITVPIVLIAKWGFNRYTDCDYGGRFIIAILMFIVVMFILLTYVVIIVCVLDNIFGEEEDGCCRW